MEWNMLCIYSLHVMLNNSMLLNVPRAGRLDQIDCCRFGVGCRGLKLGTEIDEHFVICSAFLSHAITARSHKLRFKTTGACLCWTLIDSNLLIA